MEKELNNIHWIAKLVSVESVDSTVDYAIMRICPFDLVSDCLVSSLSTVIDQKVPRYLLSCRR
jgi:hypothetical protein